jgi:uncharacterized protein (TIGR02001 family)
MAVSRSVAALCGVAGVALTALAGPASAAEFTYTFNIAGTSDYIFRGFSQTGRDATIQGGADFAYGIFYQGIWGSGLEFDADQTNAAPDVAWGEVDLYGGITPTWKSPWGDVLFNFGYIYYWYPFARDFEPGFELDYVEARAGYSTSFIKNLTTGTTVYYSPEYTSKQGEVWTIESVASYVLPALGSITPTVSGTWGWNKGEKSNLNYIAFTGNGDDHYNYWNAGITFTIDKISFDFRYWDTDIKDNNAAAGFADKFCTGDTFQCDANFVATVKVVLP